MTLSGSYQVVKFTPIQIILAIKFLRKPTCRFSEGSEIGHFCLLTLSEPPPHPQCENSWVRPCELFEVCLYRTRPRLCGVREEMV